MMTELVSKNWSVDVMAALDLVREEVGKATRQIYEAGGAEMRIVVRL